MTTARAQFCRTWHRRCSAPEYCSCAMKPGHAMPHRCACGHVWAEDAS